MFFLRITSLLRFKYTHRNFTYRGSGVASSAPGVTLVCRVFDCGLLCSLGGSFLGAVTSGFGLSTYLLSRGYLVDGWLFFWGCFALPLSLGGGGCRRSSLIYLLRLGVSACIGGFISIIYVISPLRLLRYSRHRLRRPAYVFCAVFKVPIRSSVWAPLLYGGIFGRLNKDFGARWGICLVMRRPYSIT